MSCFPLQDSVQAVRPDAGVYRLCWEQQAALGEDIGDRARQGGGLHLSSHVWPGPRARGHRHWRGDDKRRKIVLTPCAGHLTCQWTNGQENSRVQASSDWHWCEWYKQCGKEQWSSNGSENTGNNSYSSW